MRRNIRRSQICLGRRVLGGIKIDRSLPASETLIRVCVMPNFAKLFAFLLLIALLHFLFTTFAIAQTDRATLEGSVTDSSGGTISGASVKVTAVDPAISQEPRPKSNGDYPFPGPPVAEYPSPPSTPTSN